MAQPTVKTVQFTDPRIEPQPDPVYDYVIAPTQNQYYKIGASSLSNSSITFNNLTTLGVDRAYLDTFELELTATFTFNIHNTTPDDFTVCPAPDEWTFDSFPFNKCCEEAHVNINGGAFFSQPLSYIRAKEHYMSQEALAKCYENVCPVYRPVSQYESGDSYNAHVEPSVRHNAFRPSIFKNVNLNPTTPGDTITTTTGHQPIAVTNFTSSVAACDGLARPTRYGAGMVGYARSQVGFDGGFNNDIVRLDGKRVTDTNSRDLGDVKYHFVKDERGVSNHNQMQIVVTWREPIFCSPFSSRYDADYGRPLYNITSMDLTFTMQNLGNMIRIMHYHNPDVYVESYDVNIDAAALCYQVMTIPPIMKKPLTTLVPYRRFVPYITDLSRRGVNAIYDGESGEITVNGGTITVSSGVYTFNEVPNAIWIFCAPNKACLQGNDLDAYTEKINGENPLDTQSCVVHGNWDTNKQFAFIEKVDISMANTTQILSTAKVNDLYRIAKANGCEDSFASWSGSNILNPRLASPTTFAATLPTENKPTVNSLIPLNCGCGSVLRLKPGVDLIIPDQALIPAANANNMVFQARATFTIPPHAAAQNKYALWLLFEYVGVAAISPGQCEITMNPLGSGEIMAASPIVSGSDSYNESGIQGGSGFWDSLVTKFEKAQHVARETGIISRILRSIPSASAQKAADYVEKCGYGAPPSAKRARGGAVIGKGLQDWSI